MVNLWVTALVLAALTDSSLKLMLEKNSLTFCKIPLFTVLLKIETTLLSER